jgi:uncharacterized protein (DUF3084 family)
MTGMIESTGDATSGAPGAVGDGNINANYDSYDTYGSHSDGNKILNQNREAQSSLSSMSSSALSSIDNMLSSGSSIVPTLQDPSGKFGDINVMALINTVMQENISVVKELSKASKMVTAKVRIQSFTTALLKAHFSREQAELEALQHLVEAVSGAISFMFQAAAMAKSISKKDPSLVDGEDAATVKIDKIDDEKKKIIVGDDDPGRGKKDPDILPKTPGEERRLPPTVSPAKSKKIVVSTKRQEAATKIQRKFRQRRASKLLSTRIGDKEALVTTKADIATLKVEKKDLKEILRETGPDVAAARRNFKTAVGEVDAIKSDIKTKTKEITEVEGEITTQKTLRRDKKQELGKTNDAIEATGAKIGSKENKIAKVMKEQIKVGKDISAKEKELGTAVGALGTAKEDLEVEKKKLDGVDQQIKGKKQQIAGTSAEVVEIETELANLKKPGSGVSETKISTTQRSLAAKKRALVKERKDERNKLQGVKNEIARLEQKVEDMTEGKGSFKGKARAKDSPQVRAVKREIAGREMSLLNMKKPKKGGGNIRQLEKEIQGLETEVKTLTTKQEVDLTAYLKKKAELKRKLGSAKERLGVQEGDLGELKKERVKVQKEVNLLVGKVERLEGKVEDLKGDLSSLKLDKAALTIQKGGLKSLVRDLKSQKKVLTDKAKGLTSDIATLSGSIGKLKTKKVGLEDEKAELKTSLTPAEAKANKAGVHLDITVTGARKLAIKQAGATGRLGVVKRELGGLNTQKTKLEGNIKDLGDQIKGLATAPKKSLVMQRKEEFEALSKSPPTADLPKNMLPAAPIKTAKSVATTPVAAKATNSSQPPPGPVESDPSLTSKGNTGPQQIPSETGTVGEAGKPSQVNASARGNAPSAKSAEQLELEGMDADKASQSGREKLMKVQRELDLVTYIVDILGSVASGIIGIEVAGAELRKLKYEVLETHTRSVGERLSFSGSNLDDFFDQLISQVTEINEQQAKMSVSVLQNNFV